MILHTKMFLFRYKSFLSYRDVLHCLCLLTQVKLLGFMSKKNDPRQICYESNIFKSLVEIKIKFDKLNLNGNFMKINTTLEQNFKYGQLTLDFYFLDAFFFHLNKPTEIVAGMNFILTEALPVKIQNSCCWDILTLTITLFVNSDTLKTIIYFSLLAQSMSMIFMSTKRGVFFLLMRQRRVFYCYMGHVFSSLKKYQTHRYFYVMNKGKWSNGFSFAFI